MNKKIIAIAVATALTAPVAMADVKVSGRVGGHLTMSDKNKAAGTDTTKASREFGDSGQTRIQFDGKAGNAYARIAYDSRVGKSGADRDNYAGYKASFGAVQFGRMAGAAKNLEKDPYIATFLQTRNTRAEAVTAKEYGSSSFVNSLLQYSTKAGGMAVKIQFDPADNTDTSGNEGHTAIGVKGKAGGVNWWASYNNATANDVKNSSNMKVGAAMKFGSVKATLNFTQAKTDADGTWTAITAWADMGLGDGLSVNAAVSSASGDKNKGTFMRVAVNKKLSKGASLYGGVVIDTPDGGDASNVTGIGMTVKF